MAQRRKERDVSVYVVSMIQVDDPETYAKYTALTPPTVKAHGGVFLARGGSVETLEGDEFKKRLVILEFPSREAVHEWLASPEYRKAREYRVASSEASILLIEATVDRLAPDPQVVKSG